MPKPRKAQVSLEATPYYHCVSRCVRRAFLCGTDQQSGRCFEHRRQWIEDQLLALTQIFAIDLCAYAVMSNHYHVVLHIHAETAAGWSSQEVCQRWHQLFKGSPLSARFLRGDTLDPAETQVLNTLINTWRCRLTDISWLMRILNERVARQANAEDRCTGRFWEGRFKSQALLDEKALAACMAYVDLNPLRARLASSPETSEHTSITRRASTAQQAAAPNHPRQQPKDLMPFAGNPRAEMPPGLPFRLTDYLALVDWTGRILRDDKRGAISQELPAILTRLGIDPKHWLYSTRYFESRFKRLVGCAYSLKAACHALGYQRHAGITACEQVFG